ncbi:MAG: type II secretion system F family protein [Candidatus Paceibacterota bacterium]
MKFKYKAQNTAGNYVEDVADAKDSFDLARILKEKDLNMISAKPVNGGKFSQIIQSITNFGTVSTNEKILFGKNLSSMLEAGLPLSRAIEVMGRQSRNKKFKFVMNSINDSIKSGDSLSGALSKFPHIFPSLFISMVRAGEESGDLVGSLGIVSTQMEKTHELKKKIQGAMIYPGVIITAMAGIGIFMLIFIVPTLTKTFVELNVELPKSTQFIISISDAFKNNTIILLGALAFVIGLIFMGFKTSTGRRIMDWTLLHMPLVSRLVKETNSARTTRTLSALIISGVPYLTAVDITTGVMQNSYYKAVLKKAGKNVELGLPVAKIFEENQKLYPVFVSEMIAVGEETGELGNMLMKVAVYYENEVEQKTKNMSTIVEPFLMIVVGAAVGFFALSMISPMYSLVENI